MTDVSPDFLTFIRGWVSSTVETILTDEKDTTPARMLEFRQEVRDQIQNYLSTSNYTVKDLAELAAEVETLAERQTLGVGNRRQLLESIAQNQIWDTVQINYLKLLE